MIGRRLGVEFFDVGWEGLPFGTVDGELRPVLGMTPGGGSRGSKLDR
jgi:hypothetical protein